MDEHQRTSFVPPRLEALSLDLTLAGRQLLRSANLRVASGEICSVSGASGSGKSTLLRILASLASPDAGELRLDGVTSTAIAPRAYRQRVALVMQHPPMLPGSARDNLRFAAECQGASLSQAACDAVCARVGLAAPPGKDARTLSGGERFRLAIARALVLTPSVMLLDEPTAALDGESAERILALVRELAEGGTSFVVVTHNQQHVLRLGGTRYTLADGCLA